MAEPDDPESLPTQPWAGSGESPTTPDSVFPVPPRKSHSRRGGWQPPTLEELQPVFPQFEIVSVLGRGGMGAVYKCWQKRLGRFVAIKVLRPDIEDDAGNFAKRFEREAKAMARLSHPGIVSVFDAGESGGFVYFIMEYVEGADVEKLVAAQGRLSPELASTITSRLCEALAYAHENGVIHRDIKPSNVIVDARGRVKVADFGLARIAVDTPTLLTVSHAIMGTPDFMAPEALMGGTVDHRADLYAVGVMLYRMLTGELPRGRFQLPSRRVSGLDARFDDIIDHALQTDPKRRYSSAAEILTDIEVIRTTPLPQTSTPEPTPTAESEPIATPAPIPEPTPTALSPHPRRPPSDLSLAPDEMPPPAVWKPSLRDLLRVRRKLTLLEACRIGNKLASLLDHEHPAGATKGALLIHGITILFRDSLAENDADARLREPVTEWPAFDLFIDTHNFLAEGDTVFLNGLETIITAGDLAGDRVQQLARILYELLGGVAGSQFAPLAGAGEKGNKALRRGLAEGMNTFPEARTFVAELAAATADERTPPPGLLRKQTVPPVTKAIALPDRGLLPALVLGAVALTALVIFAWMNFAPPGKSSVTVHATSDKPFVNSLGMEFVPAGKPAEPANGNRLLFSVWDTRVQDYARYARETGLAPEKPSFEQEQTHPVVMVNWNDATAFCAWLTDKERASRLIGKHDQYRLPSDYEWNRALGVAGLEKAPHPPESSGEGAAIYPWGKQWPPPKGAGDYAGLELFRAEAAGLAEDTKREVIPGYDDGYVHTAPVGSFAANRYGLYDMSGNVWQWCEDSLSEDEEKRTRMQRGGSWSTFDPLLLRCTYRHPAHSEDRRDDEGFRCVLVVSGG